ncbi:MAG: NAD+ synthase [Nitrospirae bacterium]|nr:NAD+ synthase [Nitrospirota bacterium]
MRHRDRRPAAGGVRIALAQINPTVGDLEGNAKRILEALHRAEGSGADLLVTPELALTGYPPEDLLLKRRFVEENLRWVRKIARDARRCALIAGFVDREGSARFNAAAVCAQGRVLARYHKMLLPNYGVFDEVRYFRAGTAPLVINLGALRLGLTICEDIWHDHGPCPVLLRDGGVDALVNLSASPFHSGKGRERLALLRRWARSGGVWVAYCNLVGGQDELVFDGNSLVVSPDGAVAARGATFAEDLILADLPRPTRARPKRALGAVQVPIRPAATRPVLPRRHRTALNGEAEVYDALVLGTGDYFRKNGFKRAVLGLSGGIDSSLTAGIAADALGPSNVTGVALPSRFTSRESIEDAEDLARRLGIDYRVIPIEGSHAAMLEALKVEFARLPPSEAEENLQARIRGTLLMALSNKFGWLLLTTGNKSEISTGYCTLYGDTAGGFAVIKDIPKTLVYRLCRHRNTRGNVIPERVFEKPPTAELRPNQKDADSLPPYDLLDAILKLYVEEDRTVEEITAKGYDVDVVRRVASLVDRSEYKRRQAAPGVKITPKAFGRDRRMPITQRYRG